MRKSNFFLLIILECVLFLGLRESNAQDLKSSLSGDINITVAGDGSGDFETVTEAISAVPDNSTDTTIVFVQNGVYFEKLEIPASKRNLVLIGENADSTIISWDDYTGKVVGGTTIGTSTSHSMIVYAPDFLMMNMTVRNTSGDVGQAVALNTKGDRQAFFHCRFLGYQDTYYTWGYGRFYLKDCFIEGAVDYIFGRGATVFDSCQVHSVRSTSYITAASTDTNWKFGYVFRNCRLTTKPGCTGIYLGRPWKANAQTVFIECEEGSFINRLGWSQWSGNTNHLTCYYAERSCFGPGSDTTGRAIWAHQLSANEALRYSLDSIFDATVNPSAFLSDWNPNLTENKYCQLVLNHTTKFMDPFNSIARLSSISLDQIPLSGFLSDTLTYDYRCANGTIAYPVIEAFPQIEGSAIKITQPAVFPGTVFISVTARDKATNTVYQIDFTVDSALNRNDLSEAGINIPTVFGDEIKIISEKQLIEEIYIYSIAGNLILKKNFNPNYSSDIIINTSTLSSGLYLCRVKSGEHCVTKKIIKL